jgi:hypothetical protein
VLSFEDCADNCVEWNVETNEDETKLYRTYLFNDDSFLRKIFPSLIKKVTESDKTKRNSNLRRLGKFSELNNNYITNVTEYTVYVCKCAGVHRGKVRNTHMKQSSECPFRFSERIFTFKKKTYRSWTFVDEPVHTCNVSPINLPISNALQNAIKAKLLLGVDPENIIKEFRENNSDILNVFSINELHPDDILTINIVNRIKGSFGSDQKHKNDMVAIDLEIEELRVKGYYVNYKRYDDIDQTFYLFVQHPTQLEFMRRNHISFGVDSTHCVSIYKNLKLCWLVGTNAEGKGSPINYCVTNKENEDTFKQIFTDIYINNEKNKIKMSALVSDLAEAAYNGLSGSLDYIESESGDALPWFYCYYHLKDALKKKFISLLENLDTNTRKTIINYVLSLVPSLFKDELPETIDDYDEFVESATEEIEEVASLGTKIQYPNNVFRFIPSKEQTDAKVEKLLKILEQHNQQKCIQYFSNYLKYKERWYPCYRLDFARKYSSDDSNLYKILKKVWTNTHVESQFNIFKGSFLKRSRTRIDHIIQLIKEHVMFSHQKNLTYNSYAINNAQSLPSTENEDSELIINDELFSLETNNESLSNKSEEKSIEAKSTSNIKTLEDETKDKLKRTISRFQFNMDRLVQVYPTIKNINVDSFNLQEQDQLNHMVDHLASMTESVNAILKVVDFTKKDLSVEQSVPKRLPASPRRIMIPQVNHYKKLKRSNNKENMQSNALNLRKANQDADELLSKSHASIANTNKNEPTTNNLYEERDNNQFINEKMSNTNIIRVPLFPKR